MFRTSAILSLVFLSVPAIAGNLDTYNHTNEDSSVVISSNNRCSGPLKYTPKQVNGVAGHTSTTAFEARILCSNKNPCDAVMYPSNNCTGGAVASARIDLNTMNVTVLQMLDNRYKIVTGNNVVHVLYK